MYEDEIKNIIKYGELAGRKDLTSGNSGNISCRCGEHILITATSTYNAFLCDDDISVVDYDGNIVNGSKKPSSEKFLHIEFYKQRKDVNAIFHVHSPYLTAFAAAGVALDENILPEIVFSFGKIPLADYALPGSMDLVANTAKYFKDFNVILMKNHGVIVGGKDIKSAYFNLELCETYAKTVWCAKFLGGAKILPEEEVEKIYSLRK